MVEDIGKIISKGFETYTNNINLSIPFVLNAFITGLLAVFMLGLGFFYIFGPYLPSLENATSPQEIIFIILPVITQHLPEIVGLILLYFVVASFFQSFFVAGAVGMAQKATETGKSELSTMIEAGKKNVVNLYLADILVGLLSIAGIVFLVPGAMKADITQILSSANPGAILLLGGGFLLWIVYLVIISLLLAVFTYALVIDNLGPIDGILTGFRFFNNHKFDVFLMWLIIGVIVIVLAIIGEVMRVIPVMNTIWGIINMFISVFVIPPLTTLWWVRLYMERTNKKLYFNELLAHPNDLAKLRASR
jgi:hypothetical protein